MKSKRQWLYHLVAVAIMLAAACIYMAPAMQGKEIAQGDIQKSSAMSYQGHQEAERTGTIPNWAQSMFSGMPAYQIATEPQSSVFQPLRNTVIMRHIGLERNIGVLFLYLVGFYIAMLAFGLSPWLSLAAALAFALGSYNLIIIEAGHITKAWAMSMMAPIVAGLALTLRSATNPSLDASVRRRRMLWGAILFTLALILQISFNHLQITFYTVIACLAAGIAYLISAISTKTGKSFFLGVAVLLVGAALAFGSNARLLLVNEEYARYTMRGGNELTVTPDQLYNDHDPSAAQNTSNGLDINYAFSWSYGIGETYTLLVPGAMGGGSGEKVSENSSFYKTFRSNRAPLYWGKQPFTSGPVYFGALVILLFIVGLIVLRGPERWWLLAVTVISILLAWGNNLVGFNSWVFNHVPLYNKFRTPSMALVLASVAMVITAALTLKNIFSSNRDRRMVNIGLYIGTGLLTALVIIVLIASNSFAFEGGSDAQMAAQYGSNWNMIRSVLVSDRAALFRADSWRSLAFIVVGAAVLWLYNNGKLRSQAAAIAAIIALMTIDLWGIDRRYLDNDNFVEKRQLELHRDQWDYDIDDLAARYGDKDYRVFNLAVNTFNDSKPSAFHNQVGGYSAAKLSRYQNLIDFYLSRHINPQVLAMLNTRYIVGAGGQVQRVPEAFGSAWMASNVRLVGSPDEEILAINSTDLRTTAIIDTSKFTLTATTCYDSTATITLESVTPASSDYRRYTTHSDKPQLAVMSEIYYSPDWFAYIDGKPAPYLRANYVLRAIEVPAGDHTIEFRNEAPRLHRLDRLTLIFSIITLLILIGTAVVTLRKPSSSTAGAN